MFDDDTDFTVSLNRKIRNKNIYNFLAKNRKLYIDTSNNEKLLYQRLIFIETCFLLIYEEDL